jgi:hypothetical protein
MSVRRCVTCGKEFERRFGDTALTVNCPTCDLHQFEASQAPLIPGTEAVGHPTFPVTMALIAVNVLVLAFMVLRGVSLWQPTPQQAIDFGADFGPLTLGGQW